ncbi:unnamed protein product [Merluccius merluccius]
MQQRLPGVTRGSAKYQRGLGCAKHSVCHAATVCQAGLAQELKEKEEYEELMALGERESGRQWSDIGNRKRKRRRGRGRRKSSGSWKQMEQQRMSSQFSRSLKREVERVQKERERCLNVSGLSSFFTSRLLSYVHLWGRGCKVPTLNFKRITERDKCTRKGMEPATFIVALQMVQDTEGVLANAQLAA